MLAAALFGAGAASADAPVQAPYCIGDYADDLSALSPRVREYQRTSYSYSVRTIATYECLSYGLDGNVRKVRRRAVQHGTAFAYKQLPSSDGGETLLVTNQHVAEFPQVTSDEQKVDGVPPGCKKTSESIKIVDNENDAYERDDVAAKLVVADERLDVAVIKAHALFTVMPWKIGRSSLLKERNVVEVRGFPLGAFQAVNVGKVVSALDHDGYREWDHDDFVIDALLSPGNSGSPVLAISCKTGEPELVGVYHAGYTEGSALNVVVGIDQVRDLMTTLKRAPRGHSSDLVGALTGRDRQKLEAPQRPSEQYFPFGPLTASVQRRSDGALVFQVMSKEFPLRVHPIVVVEDLKPPRGRERTSFGELGRVWFGAAAGLKPYAREDLDAETQAATTRLLEALRHDALAAFAYRAAARDAASSRERFDQMSRIEKALRRGQAARREQAQGLAELAERLSPHGAETPVGLADVFAVPAPARPGLVNQGR